MRTRISLDYVQMDHWVPDKNNWGMGEQKEKEVRRRNYKVRNLGEQDQSPKDWNLPQRTKGNTGGGRIHTGRSNHRSENKNWER